MSVVSGVWSAESHPIQAHFSEQKLKSLHIVKGPHHLPALLLWPHLLLLPPSIPVLLPHGSTAVAKICLSPAPGPCACSSLCLGLCFSLSPADSPSCSAPARPSLPSPDIATPFPSVHFLRISHRNLFIPTSNHSFIVSFLPQKRGRDCICFVSCCVPCLGTMPYTKEALNKGLSGTRMNKD